MCEKGPRPTSSQPFAEQQAGGAGSGTEDANPAGGTEPIELDDLSAATSGQFVVTTRNGTRHLVDLDDWTITRIPPPGREWGPATDHQPAHITRLDGGAVGSSLYVELADGTWRVTSTIRSIRRIGR